jgi:hypothetical protein
MQHKQSVNEQKANNLFLKKLITFEKSIHQTLKDQKKFTIFKKEKQEMVQCFQYFLIRQNKPIFVFLFPEFWGKETEFIFRHAEEAKLKESWKDPLRMVFVKKMHIELIQFLEYVAFYQRLVAEISLIPPHKIQEHCLLIDDIFIFNRVTSVCIDNAIYNSKYSELLKLLKSPVSNDNNSKTEPADTEALLFKRMGRNSLKKINKTQKLSYLYLILPVKSNEKNSFETDHQNIQGYLDFLNTLETPDISQRTKIMSKNTVAKAIYGGKACYSVSSAMESPKTNKVLNFFQKLHQQFPSFSMKEICEHFQISSKDAGRMSFDSFLHSGESARSTIAKYQDVSETSGIKYNRSDCVYILRTMIGWRSFKFDGESNFYDRDLGGKLKSMNVIILSCHHVKQHYFSEFEIKRWMELPFLLSSFHANWEARDLWKRLSLKPSSDVYLQQSLALKSFCLKYNLETLETLGDSVLKFMVSMYLFWRFDEINENQLSMIR